jgi:uncharacterized protein (TIGR03083 family)
VDWDALGEPIGAGPYLNRERSALLALIASFQDEDWKQKTVCPGWDVHALVRHVIHNDLNRLSAQRDGHVIDRIPVDKPLEEIVAELDRRNHTQVDATEVWSYKLCLDLVSWLGPRTELHLRMLPPNRPGWVVSWAMAGEPAPAWLDVARELVERWVHQQQIRLATNRPTLTDPHLARLVLDTMMRALPATFQGIDAPAGTEVHVVAGEPIDRHWAVASTGTGWSMVKRGRHPAAVVHADPDLLWRRAVRMTGRADALSMSRLEGDRVLAERVFDLRGALVAGE